MAYINNSWQEILEGEFTKDYFIELQRFLDVEYAEYYGINPDRANIYRALELTPFESVKVVIVGQDPCTVPGQSNGVAFSVPIGYDIPQSVENIYDLLEKEFGDWVRPSHGCLESWASQGVLLLNCILTVRQGVRQALTHQGWGWEQFTDAIIKKLLTRENPTVFILWGNVAKKKFEKEEINILISEMRHKILIGQHPACSVYPNMKNYFILTRPFSEANAWLVEKGVEPIDWRLEIDDNNGEDTEEVIKNKDETENTIDEVDSIVGNYKFENVPKDGEENIEDIENIVEGAKAMKF